MQVNETAKLSVSADMPLNNLKCSMCATFLVILNDCSHFLLIAITQHIKM